MKHQIGPLLAFLNDESAAEVTELGVVLALIVAGCISTIVLIGPKVKQMFIDTNAVLP